MKKTILKEWDKLKPNEKLFCFRVYREQLKNQNKHALIKPNDGDWQEPHNLGFVICIDTNVFVVPHLLRRLVNIKMDLETDAI